MDLRPLVAWLCFLVTVSGRAYKDKEEVELFSNKAGPINNPSETYHFYSLPVCRPDPVVHKSLMLSEVLNGDRMAESLYKVMFKDDINNRTVCTKLLTSSDIEVFVNAIERNYYMEFVIDGIRVRGPLGQVEEISLVPHRHRITLFTHMYFQMTYNDDQVIGVNISSSKGTILQSPASETSISFTYSVNWEPTSISYRDRWKLEDHRMFFNTALELPWLSLLNSCILVVVLGLIVMNILCRVVRRDLAVIENEEKFIDQDDVGWKIVRADVFRFPQHKSLLCAILGNGTQFLVLCAALFLMSYLGLFDVQRHGSTSSVGVMVFAFTCGVSGYVSANFYRSIGGVLWAWNIIITMFLFTGPFFAVWSVLNTIAALYGATQALPIGTIIQLILLWLSVASPLTLFGGIIGKNFSSSFDSPCRTRNIPREIPCAPRIHGTYNHAALCGLIIFSSVLFNLKYLFETFWGHQVYPVVSLFCFLFVIMLTVSLLVVPVAIYFQLSNEDYRWWWRCILNASFASIFILGYSAWYWTQSSMTGLLQALEFFGYTIVGCYGLAMMLSALSFFSTLRFIRFIYSSIKLD